MRDRGSGVVDGGELDAISLSKRRISLTRRDMVETKCGIDARTL